MFGLLWIPFLVLAVWSQYKYWGVIIPYLEERGLRDGRSFAWLAERRDWQNYLRAIEEERGPKAARRERIQGWAVWIAGCLLFLIVLVGTRS